MCDIIYCEKNTQIALLVIFNSDMLSVETSEALMFSISICDDDPCMRDLLEKLVSRYFVQKNLEFKVKKFSCGEELSRYKGRTDIAFLDVEMKNLNGIQTGYSLLSYNPDVIIFIITGHREYLDDAMDLKVFRFLEKPVDKCRLYSALDIVTEQSSQLTFVSNHMPVTLREKDVVCIYSCDRRTYVLSDTGESYPTILSMKEWLKKTENIPCYSHPHYSYIINLKYVSRIDGRTIMLKCKNGISMEIEASQRKINSFKSDFVSSMRCR